MDTCNHRSTADCSIGNDRDADYFDHLRDEHDRNSEVHSSLRCQQGNYVTERTA